MIVTAKIDLDSYYVDHRVPILGRCILCGRPIPKHYRHIQLDTLNPHNLCLATDQKHLEFYMNSNDPDLIVETPSIIEENGSKALPLKKVNQFLIFSGILILFGFIFLMVIYFIQLSGFQFDNYTLNILTTIPGALIISGLFALFWGLPYSIIRWRNYLYWGTLFYPFDFGTYEKLHTKALEVEKEDSSQEHE
jgi:hypothetical protein